MLKCGREKRKGAFIMTWLDKLHHPEKYALMFLKWGLLGILMGCIGGAVGSGFHYVLHFVTHLRTEHGWLVWLLPLGGLATIGIYRIFKLQDNREPMRSSIPSCRVSLSAPSLLRQSL